MLSGYSTRTSQPGCSPAATERCIRWVRRPITFAGIARSTNTSTPTDWRSSQATAWQTKLCSAPLQSRTRCWSTVPTSARPWSGSACTLSSLESPKRPTTWPRFGNFEETYRWNRGVPEDLAALVQPNYTPILFPEENLLCYGNNSYRRSDISIHEFAHAIDYALSLGTSRGNFGSSLARAYRSALDSGLWEDTYAARSTAEYWAGGVQTWLGVDGGSSSPFGNRLHLLEYAPPIAQLIVDTLGDFQVDSSCHSADSPVKGATRKYAVQGQLIDHLGEPLVGARIHLQATDTSWTNRFAGSWPDSGYGLFALPGDYTMRLSIDGCHVFYTSSGPTPDFSSAETIFVTDQDLSIDLQLVTPSCTFATSGVVLDANGDLLESIRTTVYGTTGRSDVYLWMDDAFRVRFPNEGRYQLRFKYLGCEYVYDGDGLVRGPRYGLQFSARMLANTDLNLRLPQGACSGRIVGNVLDENGMPARGFVVGLHIPQGRSRLRIGAQGSFSIRVDLPSKPILEIATQGCRAYFGANGLTLNLDEVTPFELTNKGIEGLKIRISAEFCGLDLMTE